MRAERMDDGQIRIPRRVTGDGGEVGHTTEVIGPDHPEYQQWDEFLSEVEQAQAARPGTADPDGDAARQKLRRLEREVRRSKLVAKTSLTEEARKAAGTRVRDLQRQIREHVEATGLHRQRYREQLFLDNQPPL